MSNILPNIEDYDLPKEFESLFISLRENKQPRQQKRPVQRPIQNDKQKGKSVSDPKRKYH